MMDSKPWKSAQKAPQKRIWTSSGGRIHSSGRTSPSVINTTDPSIEASSSLIHASKAAITELMHLELPDAEADHDHIRLVQIGLKSRAKTPSGQPMSRYITAPVHSSTVIRETRPELDVWPVADSQLGKIGGSRPKHKLPLVPIRDAPLPSDNHAVATAASTDAPDFRPHSRVASRPPSQQKLIGRVGDPMLLLEINSFIETEAKLLQPGDVGGTARICREIMNRLIDGFPTYAEVLTQIRDGYDARIAQLEEDINHYLVGDNMIEKEKQKYLALQASVTLLVDQARAEAATHRTRVLQLEQRIVELEDNHRRQLSKLQEENEDLVQRAAIDRAIGREERDNAAAYAQVYNELKEKWKSACEELAQFKRDVADRMKYLELSEKCAKEESERLTMRLADEEAAWKRKHKALMETTVTPEEYRRIVERSTKLLSSVRNLEKKCEWLQADVDKKANYEPAIPWNALHREYARLREAGRSSEYIVRVLLQRLNRAEKHERTFFNRFVGLTGMRDFLSSSDFGKFGAFQASIERLKKSDPHTVSPSGQTHVYNLIELGSLLPQVQPVRTAETIIVARPVPFLNRRSSLWAPPTWCYSITPIADPMDLDYDTVKSLFVAAFVIVGSSNLPFSEALERAAREKFDFTNQAQFFSNLIFAATNHQDDMCIQFTLQILKGERHPTHFSSYFVNLLRVLYAACERKERAVVARGTGTLPKRILHECLRENLPHKSIAQLVRLKHALHMMFPHHLTKNVFYRDLYGPFAVGEPSPFLLELADQFVDEVVMYNLFVMWAIQTECKERSEDEQLTPALVYSAFEHRCTPTEGVQRESITELVPSLVRARSRTKSIGQLKRQDGFTASVMARPPNLQLAEYWITCAFREGELDFEPLPGDEESKDQEKKPAPAPIPALPVYSPCELPRIPLMEDNTRTLTGEQRVTAANAAVSRKMSKSAIRPGNASPEWRRRGVSPAQNEAPKGAEEILEGVLVSGLKSTPAQVKALHSFCQQSTPRVSAGAFVDAMLRLNAVIPMPHLVQLTEAEVSEEAQLFYNQEGAPDPPTKASDRFSISQEASHSFFQ